MAEKRLFGARDSQVDPFSAGEPELPWSEEPEPLAEDPEPADGREGDGRGGTGRSDRRADDGYSAPTRPDSRYDAPSTDEPRRGRKSAFELRPEDEAALRGRIARRKRLMWAIIAVVLVVSFAVPIANCVGSVVEGVADATNDALDDLFAEDNTDTGDWSDTFSDSGSGPFSVDAAGAEDDQAVADTLEARLEVLLADPSSGTLHELVANFLSDKLVSVLGYTADELGIDADAWATWYLGQVSVEMDSAYADGDTGTAFADVSAPYANTLVWDYYDAVSDYLYANDLWGHYDSAASSVALPSAEQREHLRAAFNEVMASAEVGEPLLASAFVTYEDGAWVVDEQDLMSSLSDVLGLY